MYSPPVRDFRDPGYVGGSPFVHPRSPLGSFGYGMHLAEFLLPLSLPFWCEFVSAGWLAPEYCFGLHGVKVTVGGVLLLSPCCEGARGVHGVLVPETILLVFFLRTKAGRVGRGGRCFRLVELPQRGRRPLRDACNPW